ncbi:MAG: Ig-like domain-containing protein [Oscillospiraceae bacterium]|nr:Ig-like domain-containing protein [Oscillospiraceae bacterium]
MNPDKLATQTQTSEKLPKQKNNRILWILLVIFSVLLLAGGIILYCLTRPVPIREISFAATELVLKEGQSALPAYTISPADSGEEELRWKTTNRSVATVFNGVITAHSEGSCMISVTSESGAKDTLTIKVEAPILEEEAPVIGAWRLFAMVEGEQLQHFYSIEASLFLYENRSGSYSYEGVDYDIKDWRFNGTEGNYTHFRCEGDGVEKGFYYCRDGSSPYDRCLILTLPDGRTLIFHRENES